MPATSKQRTIAVFGSSRAGPGTDDYQRAAEVGRRLAEAGFAVINGGYGGTMEASARGAREAGGRAVGVTTRAFRGRGGANRYITEVLSEADLFDRTRRLIESADGFIVLPGGAGTLAELAFLWALEKSSLLGRKPVLLLGPAWNALIPELRRLGLLDEQDLASTRVVSDPSEAVEALSRA